MARTFLPGAVDLASRVHKYLSRYYATLTVDITIQKLTALQNLITCLGEFLTEWRKPNIQP